MASAEKRDLEQLYANMLDGELAGLAAEAYELTDTAKPLLRAEIEKRGLGFELRQSAAPAKPNIEPLAPGEALIVIGNVWGVGEAWHAKEVLEPAGIPCYFGYENVQDIDPSSDTFNEEQHPRGVDLKVREKDVGAAVLTLRSAPPPKPAPVEEAEDIAVKCPECGSEEVVFQGLEGEDTDPDATYSWACDACGHEWKDSGLAA